MLSSLALTKVSGAEKAFKVGLWNTLAPIDFVELFVGAPAAPLPVNTGGDIVLHAQQKPGH